MFFASFQIRVFPQGESVFPTNAETLRFAIPHQLVQVNSWDILKWFLQDVSYHILSYLVCICPFFLMFGTNFKLKYSEVNWIPLPGHGLQARPRTIPWWCLQHLDMSRPRGFRRCFLPALKIVGFLPLLSRFNPWNGITISLLGPRSNRADRSQSRLSGGLYFQV